MSDGWYRDEYRRWWNLDVYVSMLKDELLCWDDIPQHLWGIVQARMMMEAEKVREPEPASIVNPDPEDLFF